MPELQSPGALWWRRLLFFFAVGGVSLLLPAVVYSIFAYLIRSITGGLIVSVVVLTFALSFSRSALESLWQGESYRKLLSHFLYVSVSYALSSIGMIMFVGAWISMILFRQGPGNFAVRALHQPRYDDFVQTYFWFLLNVLPLVDVSTTFGFDHPPIEPKSWMAGVPILIFQIIIVGYLVDVLRRAWRVAQQSLRDR